MSFYDLVMLVVFAAAILFGLWKGLAWQVASLAAIFVSYFVAMQFRGYVAPYFKTEPPWNVFGAMLVLYLGTSLVIWIAFGYVRKSIERFHLKEFDRQAGALLGGLKGALLCMVITMFSVTIASERVRSAVITSRSGNLIAHSINKLSTVVPKEIHQVLDPLLNKFNDRLNLPPTITESTQGQGGLFGNWTFPVSPNPNEVKGQFRIPVRVPINSPPSNQGSANSNLNFDSQKLWDAASELLQPNRNGNNR